MMKGSRGNHLWWIVLAILISPLMGWTTPINAAPPAAVRYADDKWAVLPKLAADASPKIDGRLSEAWWEDAAVLAGFRTAYYEHPVADRDVQYRLAYDDEYLYVGGNLSRDQVDSLHKIEIVMREKPTSAQYYVASVSMHARHEMSAAQLNTIWNPSMNELSSDEGRNNVRGFRLGITEQGDRVIVEVAIPLSSVVSAGVAPGDEWQINVIHVHHLYTKPLTSWIPIRNSNQWDNGHSIRGGTTTVYGDVIGQGRLGSVFFGRLPDTAGQQVSALGEADLRYVSFTKKELQLTPLAGYKKPQDLHLFWQAPGKAWQTLQGYELKEDGSRLSVLFDHPKPLSHGTYKLMVTGRGDDGARSLISLMTFDREYMVEAGIAAIEVPQPEAVVTEVARSDNSAQVQEVIDLIPPQPGFRYTGLPEMPDLFPDGSNLYRFGPDRKSLVSIPTGTVYPSEDPRWSESHELIITDKKGDKLAIPYHQDANGKRYFVTGHLWYVQRQEAIKRVPDIAKTDPLGAARILYAFSEAYAGYLPTFDRDGGTGFIPADSGPPFAYWGGTWNRWWWGDLGSLAPLATAYKTVKQTNAFELLSAEIGEDVEKKLVEEMFLPSVDFVQTYLPTQGNMANSYWTGLIQIGLALGDPDIIHRAVELVRDFVTEGQFLSDGFWSEVTLSYHVQTINGLVNAIELLDGWSDPEGYISPRTGLHCDNLDMASKFPIIAKALEINRIVVYPDGKYLPIQDTWGNATARQPDTSAGSFLLPAGKIGRFAQGAGRSQTQLNLNFQPKYGHVHRDGLNITLFANGAELLPDIGYSHSSKYRWFTTSTMGHNTVVVDGQNMASTASANHGGNIEAYVADEAVQIMRAAYEDAYSSVQEYTRELWMVPYAAGADSEGYILDVFRVAGGGRHEYTLQGDANRDAFFEIDKATTEYGPYLLPPGTRVTQPTGPSTSGSAAGHYAGYIYLRDVEQAELTDDQFALTLFSDQGGIAQPQLKIVGLLDAGENELFLARSPSLRPVRFSGISADNNHTVDQHTMPKMLLRREGKNLRSDFVTLLEPHVEDSGFRIEAIERLAVDGPEGAVAVRVIYGDTIDMLLSNPSYGKGGQDTITVEDMVLEGEFGFIRLIDGGVREMSLVGGTRLTKGALTLVSGGELQGQVTATLRKAAGDEVDALLTDVVLPDTVAGDYVIVRHPDGRTSGLKIERVENEGTGSRIVLAEHDPGFVIEADGSSRQVFHPRLEWRGAHTFHIAVMQRVTGLQGEPRTDKMTGLIHGTVRDQEGRPIAGAVVHAAGYTQPAAVTDADGSFRLDRLPTGKQWLKADHRLFAPSLSDGMLITEKGEQVTLTLGERLPPQLSDVPEEVDAGETITLVSSVDAIAYLMERTSSRRIPTAERVRTEAIAHVEVLAGVRATLPTDAGLHGSYVVHAIDAEDRVSAGVPVYIENQAEMEKLWQFLDSWQW